MGSCNKSDDDKPNMDLAKMEIELKGKLDRVEKEFCSAQRDCKSLGEHLEALSRENRLVLYFLFSRQWQ